MKKYLAIFAVLCTVILSSCSNDDIPVAQTITFKVNPSTVVSSYREYAPGELSTLLSDYNLRIRLLIYNEAGKLVAEDETYMNDYTHIMTSSFNLEQGLYTAVSCTDVVSDNKTFEFWDLSGKESLSTATFTDNGYIGAQFKILGFNVTHFSVDNNAKELNVNVKPAVALALVMWENWNRYTNVEAFRLYANRSCDNMTLNASGEPTYSVESSNDVANWRIAALEYDSQYNGGYVYVFLFPIKNMTMQFGAGLTDNTYALFDNAMALVDIELGKEYYFAYDVTSEECEWLVWTDVDTSSSTSTLEYYGNNTTSNGFECNQSIRVMDFVQPGNLSE